LWQKKKKEKKKTLFSSTHAVHTNAHGPTSHHNAWIQNETQQKLIQPNDGLVNSNHRVKGTN